MMKTILVAGLFLTLLGCAGMEGSSSSGSKEVENINFYQHWVHSYEEQGGQKTPNIFRPAGAYPFPPSRFRMAFGFDPSGQCNYKYLSPDDRHEMRSCIYTKIGNKVYIYDDRGVLLKHLSFTLVEPAGKDIMRMSYGVQAAPKKVFKP